MARQCPSRIGGKVNEWRGQARLLEAARAEHLGHRQRAGKNPLKRRQFESQNANQAELLHFSFFFIGERTDCFRVEMEPTLLHFFFSFLSLRFAVPVSAAGRTESREKAA